MSGVEVRDSGDLRKYRTEVPNLVFEMSLSPYALALYMHFRRTAGDDGKCWKSTRTLASDTGISAGTISKARKELEERKLIGVQYPENNNKSIIVTIIDIWPENFQHFASSTGRSKPPGKTRSGDEQPVQETNATCSPGERKKELLEEGTSQESNDSCSGESQESDSPAIASPKKIPSGKYGVSFLMDRLKEGRDSGAAPPPLTNRQRGEYGQFFAQDYSDGTQLEECELTLRWLVAKACGDVDNEPEAWAYYGTAQRAVRDGWKPKRALRAVSNPEADDERDREWAEIEAMTADILRGVV